MKIADQILKYYQHRYDNFSNKLESIDDVLESNNKEAKEFLEKIEKLEKLDAKLSQVEAKIQIINRKIDNSFVKLETLNFENSNQNIINENN